MSVQIATFLSPQSTTTYAQFRFGEWRALVRPLYHIKWPRNVPRQGGEGARYRVIWASTYQSMTGLSITLLSLSTVEQVTEPLEKGPSGFCTSGTIQCPECQILSLKKGSTHEIIRVFRCYLLALLKSKLRPETCPDYPPIFSIWVYLIQRCLCSKVPWPLKDEIKVKRFQQVDPKLCSDDVVDVLRCWWKDLTWIQPDFDVENDSFSKY